MWSLLFHEENGQSASGQQMLTKMWTWRLCCRTCAAALRTCTWTLHLRRPRLWSTCCQIWHAALIKWRPHMSWVSIFNSTNYNSSELGKFYALKTVLAIPSSYLCTLHTACSFNLTSLLQISVAWHPTASNISVQTQGELLWGVANYLDDEGFNVKSLSFDAKTRGLYIHSKWEIWTIWNISQLLFTCVYKAYFQQLIVCKLWSRCTTHRTYTSKLYSLF